MQGKTTAYGGPLAAKEITPDKRADSVNEKCPDDSFPLNALVKMVSSE